jgi:hypothetical protein
MRGVMRGWSARRRRGRPGAIAGCAITDTVRDMPTPSRRGPGLRRHRAARRWLVAAAVLCSVSVPATGRVTAAPTPAGRVLRVHVADAFGGKTVIGQLTVANATGAGHVTAFACDAGLPVDPNGRLIRSDLNYFGDVAPIWSNRLVVEADDDGDVCFYTLQTVDMIVDVNAVSFDTGIASFPNRRTDTRTGSPAALDAGGTLELHVPEAVDAKTVIGQLTVAGADRPGHVTAYPCADGPPTAGGRVSRSDLNYFGNLAPIWSNRLVVQADDDGNICFDALTAVDLVVDLNGVSDTGIASFPNRRTDTRTGSPAPLDAGDTLELHVPEATDAKTVIGQLTVADADRPGHITAYPCADGPPTGDGTSGAGTVTRSDLNYFGDLAPIWSNRLVVQADGDGNICFDALTAVDLVVDINGVGDTGIFSFPNERTDTRRGEGVLESPFPPLVDGVPVWPAYEPVPGLAGVAALTGLGASAAVSTRPIVAVKIDNYRLARPQWGLEHADAVIEVQVEGVSRLVALYQSVLPAALGPVRSARTTDLDLLTSMNRPVFAYSGSNPGVAAWLESAESSGLLVDFSAQEHGCYARRDDRPGPHNLGFDPACALSASPSAGPARPLWNIAGEWSAPATVASATDARFAVPMAGVAVGWTWDPASGTYLRSQDGEPHVGDTGAHINAHTVVEVVTEYIPSPVDERSPHAVTTGSGAAVVHREGRAYPATWWRATAYDGWIFRAADGTEIPVDLGRTFLELTPG